MSKHKITQNINKDAGLNDLPEVNPQRSTWENKFSNYTTCNIGDIVPIYAEVCMPKSKKKITMGMISHMTTPIAPIFNAQYTEFRVFWVPHRLSADLLAGYKTRKSPWVKVFGEDNASSNASVIVPLANQKLPQVSNKFTEDLAGATLNSFGGILDALDLETDITDATAKKAFFKNCNFLNLAAYELIYQKAYRNQNRETATESDLYKFLFDGYNRTGAVTFVDSFHKAQREKDYFTGSQPFTLKASSPVSVGLLGEAPVSIRRDDEGATLVSGASLSIYTNNEINSSVDSSTLSATDAAQLSGDTYTVYADLTSAAGVDIESLRLMIKTQEMLEKDMLYGSDYASYLNAHFGCAPISTELQEPLELHKVTITSQMQAIFQSSSTTGESTILGTIGANATTQSGEFEILPETEFKEWGYLMVCAVHKAQNAYDARLYKPKYLFKKARFEHYSPELDDLGYQSVVGAEFNPKVNGLTAAVSYNEAFAEDRYVFNKVHGMFEASRTGALDYWVMAASGYNDIQSLYKQTTTELDRAISVKSNVAPQFFDAFGFSEINTKPMKLHSIPGFDGVI